MIGLLFLLLNFGMSTEMNFVASARDSGTGVYKNSTEISCGSYTEGLFVFNATYVDTGTNGVARDSIMAVLQSKDGINSIWVDLDTFTVIKAKDTPNYLRLQYGLGKTLRCKYFHISTYISNFSIMGIFK